MGQGAHGEIGNRRAIRDSFGRLGMHASPAEVVRELTGRGIAVSKDLVQAVRLELLKEGVRLHHEQAARRRGRQPHRPQKRPPRQVR